MDPRQYQQNLQQNIFGISVVLWTVALSQRVSEVHVTNLAAQIRLRQEYNQQVNIATCLFVLFREKASFLGSGRLRERDMRISQLKYRERK